MDWESKFVNWSKGPGDTEKERCENAERIIRDALNSDETLSRMNITVFTQGSYKARTNISQDSDVDICVLLRDSIFVDYPDGFTDQNSGLSNDGMTYSEFKELVEKALVKKFGRKNVVRGNKAFDIHENTYRVAADVVPAFEHRRYTGEYDYFGKPTFSSGIEFRPDNGVKVINWPDQTYENGVSKNDATSRCYKRIIRIIKRLRNEMQDEGIKAANDIASFLIESLVWNTPNGGFSHTYYVEDVRYVLAHIFNNTMTDEACHEWGEVNELKYLFRIGQPWTRQQAHGFISAAWDYIGYK